MKRSALFLAVLALCVSGSALAATSARVFSSPRGRALTAPSRASASAVAVGFLRAHGLSEAAERTLRTTSEARVERTGMTHVRLEQEAGGLRVHGGYARAAVDARGELVHLVDGLVPVRSGAVAGARIDEREALRVALGALYPELRGTPAQLRREGNTTVFARDAFFHEAPSVERVAVPGEGGSLSTGFLVQTWSERRNLLHETLVSGEGRVLDTELRTASDSYRVFAVNPETTPQTIVTGPGAGNGASPAGWLVGGAQSSWSIAGNNVHAYLDAEQDNAADPGGDVITSGDFLAVADLSAQPSTPDNKSVAVQNLFYLNNVLHDVLYARGFTEAAGNFQEDNFGRGGRGSDSVNAEAQDGGGTDNANFATPRDGRNPRMQMYLWSGLGTHQVRVHTPASIAATYLAQGAAFGPALDAGGITGDVVLVNDGVGTATDACEAIQGSLAGKVALIDRGSCDFVVKTKNAQAAGAVAVIIANNNTSTIFTMGGSDSTLTIPAVMVSQSDGQTLRSVTGVNATVALSDPPPLMRDGDVDADVVFHEYGHGLTWRMIGRMDGALAGAIGEGMSDVLACLLTDDDRVGEYSASDPAGIRTAPYASYPRSYGDITGSEVHLDGEVYGAIGWRLWELFQRAGLSRDLLLTYLVDGMNYTPAAPAYEDMRDGILQAVAVAGAGHECLVWEAFAAYGVGVGASGTTRGSKAVITESFALPPECAAP